MRKVQIPHNAGSMINPNRYGFCRFCGVCPDFPIDMPFCTYRVICMLSVRCLSAEKKKAYSFICKISIVDTKGFLKCLKCLLFMLLHLRSAVADYLPSGSPICSLGVTLAPKVLWGYKRQSAVCKSAFRAFVPAIRLSFRNNFSSAVGSVKHQSADI